MARLKTKSAGSPAFFSPPGHAPITSLATFLFCPTWEPFHRLTTSIPTGHKKYRASQRTYSLPVQIYSPWVIIHENHFIKAHVKANVKWRAKKKELIKHLEACNHLEVQTGGNLLEEIFPLSGTVQDWSREVLSPAKNKYCTEWCYLRASLVTLCCYRPLQYIHTIFFFTALPNFSFLKASCKTQVLAWKSWNVPGIEKKQRSPACPKDKQLSHFADHYTFLGNCLHTPPLSQH